jgi:hypothetical protein
MFHPTFFANPFSGTLSRQGFLDALLLARLQLEGVTLVLPTRTNLPD